MGPSYYTAIPLYISLATMGPERLRAISTLRAQAILNGTNHATSKVRHHGFRQLPVRAISLTKPIKHCECF